MKTVLHWKTVFVAGTLAFFVGAAIQYLPLPIWLVGILALVTGFAIGHAIHARWPLFHIEDENGNEI